MKSPGYFSRLVSVCVCLTFVYALIVPGIAPFSSLNANASEVNRMNLKSSIAGNLSSSLISQNRAWPSSRNGEVLVRFRANTSEYHKAVTAVAHGAQRRKLRGESRIEKFINTAGQSAAGLAQQLMHDQFQRAVVRTSDGTKMTFVSVTVNNEFRCTQIKDRNGNYLTATYDLNNGHLQTITDTLGRVITFLYYADGNLERLMTSK